MAERTWRESFEVTGSELLVRVKQLIKEGNVRHISIKQGGRTVAEFPLALGVVGAVFMPMLAAIGALATLVARCTIEVERVGTAGAGSARKSVPRKARAKARAKAKTKARTKSKTKAKTRSKAKARRRSAA